MARDPVKMVRKERNQDRRRSTSLQGGSLFSAEIYSGKHRQCHWPGKFFPHCLWHGQCAGGPFPYKARKIIFPLFNGSRVYVSWCIETSIKRMEAQAIFLSIMCLETSMPLGGEIHIGRQKDKTLVKGSSSNFSYNTELWNSLLQPSHRHDIALAQVNFLLLPLICQQMEKPINLDKSADNTAFYITF